MDGFFEDTIVGIGTPLGKGGLGIVRVSGNQAIEIINKHFKGKNLTLQLSHTLHYGKLVDAENQLIDEVVVGLFRNPKSYTKENVVEISCHCSPFILNKVVEILVKSGCRMAQAGEFTKRAFLNGGLDLTQAEAVGDLIASESSVAHRLAMNGLRGGLKDELQRLRTQLVDFVALIELELDFSEEDVEFAKRDVLLKSIINIKAHIQALANSFQAGNAIVNGFPVAIVGKPNVGKSTLLNGLLNDEKAIVSPIAGTTRDVVEDRLFVGGFELRIMDTAGLRESEDVIEIEGVKRTIAKIKGAVIVVYVFDVSIEDLETARTEAEKWISETEGVLVLVGNKVDLLNNQSIENKEIIYLSAQKKIGLEALEERLLSIVLSLTSYDTILSNQRHLDCLLKTVESLTAVEKGIGTGLSGELLSVDIREALNSLGEITGEVTNNEVLGAIFSRFCIGK